jgi:hypothetical protein
MFAMQNKYAIALLAVLTEAYLIKREGLRGGATDEEVFASMPCDDIIPHPMVETTHAITIRAPASEIWPWLVQMGYYRAGWYADPRLPGWWDEMADRVLRAFLTGEERGRAPRRKTPSADHILPQFQNLHLGDVIEDGPPGTAYFNVKGLEANHFLALYSTTHIRYLLPASLRNNPRLGIFGDFTWVFTLKRSDEQTTRLILRTRANYGPKWVRLLSMPLLLTMEAVMPHRTLLNIKERVECTGKAGLEELKTGEPLAST